MRILLSKNLLSIVTNSNKRTGKRKSENLSTLEWKILILAIKEFQRKNWVKLGSTRKTGAVDIDGLKKKICFLNEDERTININKELRKDYLKKHRIEKIKNAIMRLNLSYLPFINEKEKLNVADVITDAEVDSNKISFKFETKMIKNIYFQELQMEEKGFFYNGYSSITEDVFRLKRNNSYPLFILLCNLKTIDLTIEELNKLFKSNYSKDGLRKLFKGLKEDIDSLDMYTLEIKRGERRVNEKTGKIEYFSRFTLKVKSVSEDVKKASDDANKNEFYKNSCKEEILYKLSEEFSDETLISAINKSEKSLRKKVNNFGGYIRKLCLVVEEEEKNFLSTLKKIPN